MKTLPTLLLIGGSDSGGGAGIQGDLKTAFALGCFATTALTAVTAQNGRGVKRVAPLSQELLRSQLEAIQEGFPLHGIKVGALCSPESVELLATFLKGFPSLPVVLDPVLRATSGACLCPTPVKELLMEQLFPLATVITPNEEEAGTWTGVARRGEEAVKEMGAILMEMGANSVLVTGGEREGREARDHLFQGMGRWSFSSPKVPTENSHGTGCALSTAITAFLVQGSSLLEAVQKAKAFVTSQLHRFTQFDLGEGKGALLPVAPLCLKGETECGY